MFGCKLSHISHCQIYTFIHWCESGYTWSATKQNCKTRLALSGEGNSKFPLTDRELNVGNFHSCHTALPTNPCAVIIFASRVPPTGRSWTCPGSLKLKILLKTLYLIFILVVNWNIYYPPSVYWIWSGLGRKCCFLYSDPEKWPRQVCGKCLCNVLLFYSLNRQGRRAASFCELLALLSYLHVLSAQQWHINTPKWR